MKRRLVFKKARFLIARSPSHVLKVSNKVVKWLKPLCKRIEIAGSIRRKEPRPVDIDLVIIPKNKEKIIDLLKTKGKFLQGGDKRASFKIDKVKTELYFTTPESWGATLLSYTGPSGSAIGLRILARKKGFLLNQYGLFNRKTKKLIVGKTEKEIYEKLGKKYKPPHLR
jgi:DNA polymerase (family 10)